jgi:hypothetical protein
MAIERFVSHVAVKPADPCDQCVCFEMAERDGMWPGGEVSATQTAS